MSCSGLRLVAKMRDNPLLLPRVEIVDTVFDLVMLGVKRYIDYYNSLSIITDDSLILFCSSMTDTWILIKDSLAKIKKAEDMRLYVPEVVECNKYLSQYFDNFNSFIKGNRFDKQEVTFFLDMSNNLRDKVDNLVVYFSSLRNITIEEFEIRQIPYDTGEHIKYIDVHFDMFIDQIKVFMKGQSAFEPSGLSKLEKFINEYNPTLPKVWNEVTAQGNSIERSKLQYSFYLMSDEAEALYAIPYRMSVHIYSETAKKHAQCKFDERLGVFNLDFYVLPRDVFSRLNRLSPTRAEYWYGMSLHECVHVLQYLLGIEKKIHDFTGLPYPRGSQYRQNQIDAENAVKLQYQINGLNPDIVSFHSLDDVEFYTRLLDIIMTFMSIYFKAPPEGQKLDFCSLEVEIDIEKYISTSSFFNTLKEFQIHKYNLAVKEFKQAVLHEADMLEQTYVCKVRDARMVKKGRNR